MLINLVYYSHHYYGVVFYYYVFDLFWESRRWQQGWERELLPGLSGVRAGACARVELLLSCERDGRLLGAEA